MINTTLESSLIFNVMRYWPIKKLVEFKGKLKNTISERSLILAFKEMNWLRNSNFRTFSEKTSYVIAGITVINSSTLVVAGDINTVYLYKFYLVSPSPEKPKLNNTLIFELNTKIEGLTSLIKLNDEYIIVGSNTLMALIKIDVKKGKLHKVATFNYEQNQSIPISGLLLDSQLDSTIPPKILFVGFQNGNLLMLNETLELLATIKGLHSFAVKFIVCHQEKIITAGGDGRMSVIDPKNQISLSEFQFEDEHQLGINFMASNYNTIITGGTDRFIKVWTLNSKKSIKTIECFSNMAFSFKYFFQFGFLVSGDCNCKIVINNFYTDNFEVMKCLQISIVPHYFDADPHLSAIVAASKVNQKELAFILCDN